MIPTAPKTGSHATMSAMGAIRYEKRTLAAGEAGVRPAGARDSVRKLARKSL